MKTAIFDGSYLLYRCRFGAEKSDILSANGISFIFICSIFKFLENKNIDEIYVLWDDGIPEHKKVSSISYKGDRVEDFSIEKIMQNESKKILKNLLPQIGIISAGCNSAEADDLAFLLVNNKKEGILISEDKDWYYCLINDNWSVFRPVANKFVTIQDLEILNPFKNSEINIDILTYYMYTESLCGSHNNIPRIVPKGIGVFKSISIITAFLTSKILPYFPKDETSQKEIRDLINRNYSLIEMNWILSDIRPKNSINDAVKKTQKLKIKPNLEQWIKIANLLDSTTLINKYSSYIKNCSHIVQEEI